MNRRFFSEVDMARPEVSFDRGLQYNSSHIRFLLSSFQQAETVQSEIVQCRGWACFTRYGIASCIPDPSPSRQSESPVVLSRRPVLLGYFCFNQFQPCSYSSTQHREAEAWHKQYTAWPACLWSCGSLTGHENRWKCTTV